MALAGCGATTTPTTPLTISISSYQTNCTTAADCVPVYMGNICECRCANAAINQADQDRYWSDYTAISSGCTDQWTVTCIHATETCTSGVCGISY